MPEPKSIPHVTTTPKPFGVNVEWKWPVSCLWLELQYLHEDGRLVKDLIHWPAVSYLIPGLKAGERLQVRLRPVEQDGSTRDWRTSDWIEAVSSVDAGEMIEALTEEIRNSRTLNDLTDGWFIAKSGQVFINNAAIGDEMKQAVIDAVRESDLFASLQAKIDAQKASVVGLQQAMHEAVTEAIKNALKPGGLIWNNLRGR